jgi:predicted metal-binding protein
MAASESDLKPGDPLVSVCVTCKAALGAEVHGPALVDALRAALAGKQVAVRPVQCLGVCKRPTTVAVSGAQGFTFVFGDLAPAAAADIATFVQSYRVADYGFVPWRQRPEILRRGLVARLPPAAWSPEDGSPPA